MSCRDSNIVEHRRSFAATRSHNDAASANEQTKLLDQWLLGLNGVASTATLTFMSTQTFHALLWKIPIILALAAFAAGVVFGAKAIRAHSKTLYKWVTYWNLYAGIGDLPNNVVSPSDIISERNKAIERVKTHTLWFRMCITAFIIGCASFAAGIWSGI